MLLIRASLFSPSRNRDARLRPPISAVPARPGGEKRRVRRRSVSDPGAGELKQDSSPRRRLPYSTSSILRGQLCLSRRDSDAVGEHAAAGLAARAVVGLVLGVDDALHGRPAHGTRLAVAAMHGHAFAKRSHFLGETRRLLGPQAVCPLVQHRLRCPIQAVDVLFAQRLPSWRSATAARDAGSHRSRHCRCR